ncbi:hypothetical protein L861_16865 [Litchfieldella anticariensis FP35 = DSM 16096]|uniref:NADH:flavin oxidoreductase/NADH oxidase N-terminal domain-containing protein n=1 Tax=Litchfieldella anticariensis (strain DSM 16096 / CECT 5854 / CIP 108499 / LMG 22089 / FP35) TaxID=1121939 RepID=S2KM52_LITA3|nr:alkene reductase [Halomonas anticariensis]EPC01543.1 hypothetical protein L861_16865 [Halomonas anticariensis FP35 = DSM 16096]
MHLLAPIQLGSLSLPNRIIMAPLTRQRTRQPGNVPYGLNATYYAQRASAGLIITEGAQINAQGQGFAWTPGIHSKAQIDGWRKVTEAVHARGGRIVLQLWHVGRVSHRLLQPDAAAPVAPSAIRAEAKAYVEFANGHAGFAAADQPRALELDDLPHLVEDFAQAAANCMHAGFDGVEVQAGNGFLLDQFLSSGTNHRDDAYGGKIANRARLPLEVLDAVVDAIGDPGRVGIHFSPLNTYNDMHDADPHETFPYMIDRLNERDLAYLHLTNPRQNHEAEALLTSLRHRYRGHVIRAGGYDAALGNQAIRTGATDGVVFGKPFISNPDLVERIRHGVPWTMADEESFYGGGAKGYTDYPRLQLTDRYEELPDSGSVAGLVKQAPP